jgi:hypothetical protein
MVKSVCEPATVLFFLDFSTRSDRLFLTSLLIGFKYPPQSPLKCQTGLFIIQYVIDYIISRFAGVKLEYFCSWPKMNIICILCAREISKPHDRYFVEGKSKFNVKCEFESSPFVCNDRKSEYIMQVVRSNLDEETKGTKATQTGDQTM